MSEKCVHTFFQRQMALVEGYCPFCLDKELEKEKTENANLLKMIDSLNSEILRLKTIRVQESLDRDMLLLIRILIKRLGGRVIIKPGEILEPLDEVLMVSEDADQNMIYIVKKKDIKNDPPLPYNGNIPIGP